MKEPPTKSDEKNCNVRYRIEPSGIFIYIAHLFQEYIIKVIGARLWR